MQEPVIDGRTARSRRTREAIVDATIQLLEDGDLRPTAPRIAERAGVSVRSVFQHFDELERLHAAVAERLAERVAYLVLPIDPALPLDARLDQFLLQRTQLLEAVTPIRRAADVHGPFSAEIRARLGEGQQFLRDEVALTFGPELDAHADGPDELLDLLDAVCSWAMWDELRGVQGLGAELARDRVRRLAAAVLAQAGHHPDALAVPSA